MKKHIKAFIMNGLFVCGLGPVVLAIAYAVLYALGVVSEMSVTEMVMGSISVTVLAFIAGGISVIYKVERLPITLAALIHAGVLYLDYIVIYLINGWLKEGVLPFVIFTSCFFAGFALVWLIIYLTTKKSTEEVNSALSVMQSEAE
jgi:hypothetical protein